MSNHDREGSHPSNRDAPLERAWREASDEQPPAHLDAAIIAAARKSTADHGKPSVTAPPRATSHRWLTQWQPLAAAATVAGLAFVLVQQLPREHRLGPELQRQESAPAATAAPSRVQPQLQDSAAREATDNRQAPGAEATASSPERTDVVAGRAPEQDAIPAPSLAPVSPAAKAAARASDASAELGVRSEDRASAVAPTAAGRVAPAAPAASATTATDSEKSRGNAATIVDDADAWAARIANLHAAGDVTAAEQALRAFRAADPDADTFLPESLRDWARTVH
jgi:hypothetical protein